MSSLAAQIRTCHACEGMNIAGVTAWLVRNKPVFAKGAASRRVRIESVRTMGVVQAGVMPNWHVDQCDVFRVPPDKVIAFAKSPHGQTTFRR
jgi:hypothetical protein